MVGLNFEDIDYSKEYLHIQRACIIRDLFSTDGERIGREKVLKDTKSECGVRDIPIPMLIDDFKTYTNYCISEKYNISANEPIFRNCKGGRYTQESLRDLFHKLTKELGITQLGCYSLRHRFCLFNNYLYRYRNNTRYARSRRYYNNTRLSANNK